jgi:hypothetical protein
MFQKVIVLVNQATKAKKSCQQAAVCWRNMLASRVDQTRASSLKFEDI